MTRRTAVIFVVALVATCVACAPEKSERELLVEASTLAHRGEIDEARAIFEHLLETDPESPDVLIRYAGFLVDAGEMDTAGTYFERLATVDLHGGDAARLETERRRYFRQIYDGARAGAPAAPADRDAYERGLIGLINIDGSDSLLDEYNAYLIMQARAALGRDPERPLRPNDGAVVRAATPDGVAASLAYVERLLDGDPRCDVRREPSADVLSEATGLRAALKLESFRDGFDALWSTRYRDAFLRDGRFDADTSRFLHHYEGPYREGVSAESGVDRLTYQAQTWHAREVATDLAYELAGRERGGAPPLPYRVEDFATAEATLPSAAPDGLFVFDLALPYDTVVKGALLLNERVEAGATGDGGDGSGSGDGTGS